MIPHCAPPAWPEPIAPGRFASLVRTDAPDGCAVALLGLADDTGVALNSGRPGARDGPDALRGALARFGGDQPASGGWPSVFDAGNIIPGTTLDETHDRVTSATNELIGLGLLPIGIGGGHDLTFPFVRAVAQHCAPMTGVYFDPHLDVRPEPGSGMSFRRLVEDCSVRELHIHGMEPMVNSADHLSWFQTHGGHIDTFGPRDPWPAGDLFVSLDLDVIDQSCAPGVSAMNPCGWSPDRAREWVDAAGRNERVRCFDIMELNPRFDEQGRTARLAAMLVLTFLRAFAERAR